jgi:hypothetical protein
MSWKEIRRDEARRKVLLRVWRGRRSPPYPLHREDDVRNRSESSLRLLHLASISGKYVELSGALS